MAWSYEPAIRTNRNRLREVIGDTNKSDELLADEILDEVLTDHNDVVSAAAISSVELILARLARLNDRTAGVMTTSRSQQFTQYSSLLTKLRGSAAARNGRLFVGGVSKSDNEAANNDTDFNKGKFSVGQDDRFEFDNQRERRC